MIKKQRNYISCMRVLLLKSFLYVNSLSLKTQSYQRRKIKTFSNVFEEFELFSNFANTFKRKSKIGRRFHRYLSLNSRSGIFYQREIAEAKWWKGKIWLEMEKIVGEKLVLFPRLKNPTLGDDSSYLMTSKGPINRCSQARFIEGDLGFYFSSFRVSIYR